MTKLIKLSRTYEAHGVAFAELKLRAPIGADYWSLGPIAEWQPVGGSAALISHHDTIKAYAERLTEGDGVARLAVLDLGDTLKVEEAVRGFFADARKSTSPSTSSSGT